MIITCYCNRAKQKSLKQKKLNLNVL